VSTRLAAWIAPRTAWRAAAWYLAITLLMTWPLARGLERDIPWDLGDSLLNCWILGWNAERLLRLLGGDLSALHGFYDTNIFHPQPLTLAYSELLLAQTLQILPVYGLTGNLVLCYNLLVVSSFVLSGVGMFLLVRELAGDWRAGFFAGLTFAFLPWRFGQMPHVQVLATQWMPLALYGLRRYFVSRRLLALAGAAAALLLNNHSNGYFLLFFAPFVAGYVLWEMATRGLLGDLRAWVAMAGTGALVGALTVPFMLPYVWLRRLTGARRSVDEVQWFSADVYAYLTAEPALRLFGPWLQTYPRPEGVLFQGVTPLMLAALALAWGLTRTWRASRPTPAIGPAVRAGWRELARRVAIWGALVVAAIYLAVAAVLLAGAGGRFIVGPIELRMTSLTRALRVLAGAAVVLAVASPRVRAMLRLSWRSPRLLFGLFAVAGWWLSLGPRLQAWGRELNAPSLYGVFYRFVPGFDGLRVPARFAVIVALALSVLAGFAVRDLARRWRPGAWLVLLAVFFLAESAVVPMPLNLSTADRFVAPPAQVHAPAIGSPVYRYVTSLPADAVLLEFPFGDVSWELRYVYYSTAHWRPLVNGYSGGFPESYLRLRGYLDDPFRAPNDAWDALKGSGATHVILHGHAYRGDEASQVRSWLEGHGARVVAEFGPSAVFRLPSRGAR
jgi:hypothetical protein